MQKYNDQGIIEKGKQQSIREYCENLQKNTDVLRGNFPGKKFPTFPVVGQHCFREDLNVEYVYTEDGWIENDKYNASTKELEAARGTAESLAKRLDKSLNPDGSIKANADVALSSESIAVKGVDTINLADGAVTNEKIADNAITLDKIAEGVLRSQDFDVRSTRFKNHIASGMGVEISEATGEAVVTPGRAFINNEYLDLFKEQSIPELKNKRGLLYAEKAPNGKEVSIGFKEFIRPSQLPQIKAIPADDLRFMAEFEVNPATPAQAIPDLSGGGANLSVAGAPDTVTFENRVGWISPRSGKANNTYWRTADKAFKGIKAGPWSMLHYFIPDENSAGTFPFSFWCTEGYAWNVYFKLSDYNAKDQTFNFGVYNNRYENTSSGIAGHMCRVYRNRPNLVVYEIDETSSSIYVNGVLVYKIKAQHTFEEGRGGRICIGAYANSLNYIGSQIPLFSCIRNGNWGESAIASMANMLGLPNEHMGFDAKTPKIFRDIETSERHKGFHAWNFAEDSGMYVYDENKANRMDGTLVNCGRIESDGKSDSKSVAVVAASQGHVSFGNYGLPDEFSMFVCCSIYADGTVMSCYDGNTGGFIVDVSSRQIRLWLNGWNTTGLYIPFGTPVIIGVTINKRNGTYRVYADSLEYNRNVFAPSTAFGASSPLYIGRRSTAYSTMSIHAACMANRTMADGEISAVFRAYKTRKYRNILDDMGLTDKAVIGMIKTDGYGRLEHMETYPRWGRRLNPYHDKYFLGWYQSGAAGEVTIPNLYGTARAKVNVYAQLDKNSSIIKYMGGFVPGVASTGALSGTGFDILGINSDCIRYYVEPTAIGKGIKAVSAARTGGNVPWIGFEMEPMAENEEIDNSDF